MLLLLIGAVLTVYVCADFLFTTIGGIPSRFLSFRIAKWVFAVFRWLPDLRLRHAAVGPVVMSAVALWWVAGIGVGWGMIFDGFDRAVILSKSGADTGFLGALSHAGHLLSTLGGGKTEPSGLGYALLGVMCAVNGMVVLTLSVSFVLSTTQTVSNGRGLLLLRRVMGPGEADYRSTVLPQLATLVAQLNTAPFALFYSHSDPEMRLPRMLVEAFGRDDAARVLLSSLPQEPEPTIVGLRDWAKAYRLSPRSS
ncbi:hypothetical protein BOO69_20905 (plasmid) [Sulfitobacter alexandrii]|uniref:Ion channel n=1 Tax=Sulfitobacter alexandrii TaxID=1917485 RepID=A0A1J0WPC8_9RHOB|nr:hypothetical protein [Sulfitobacter alexandrii]APE46016.1 hypothetical protein BOO69_20905 [Sulfitobacter alexandrii]